MSLVWALTVAVVVFYGLSFIIVGLKVLFADTAAYEQNRARVKGVWASMCGDLNVAPNHGRDARVAAGMAVDRRTRKVIPRGRLSDEAIDSIRPS
jgi:hypothetical protein